jgi:hypothetical protein
MLAALAITLLTLACDASCGPVDDPPAAEADPPRRVVGIDIDAALDRNGDGFVSDAEETGYARIDTAPPNRCPAVWV